MKRLSFFTVLILFYSVVFSQQLLDFSDTAKVESPFTQQFPSSIHLSLGLPSPYYDLGFSNMRSFIEREGFALDELNTLVSFSAAFRLGRFVVEAGNFSTFGNVVIESNGRSFTQHLTYSSILLGFLLLENRQFHLYFRSGAGYNNQFFQLTRGSADSGFDFTTAEPTNLFVTPYLKHSSWNYDVSLAIQMQLNRQKTGLFEELRLGYRSGFQDQDWTTNNANNINARLDRMRQIYLSAIFTFAINFEQK